MEMHAIHSPIPTLLKIKVLSTSHPQNLFIAQKVLYNSKSFFRILICSLHSFNNCSVFTEWFFGRKKKVSPRKQSRTGSERHDS